MDAKSTQPATGMIDRDITFDDGPSMFSSIGIQVHRADDDDYACVRGRLLNLSPTGAKLSLESAIPAQDAVTVRLHNVCLNTELSTSGRIRRIQSGGNGSWTVGCLFSEPLPRAVLRSLFHGDLAEQRRSVRYSVAGDAKIDWEAGAQNVVVRLQDVSTGGFQMLVGDPSTIGSRLTLVLHTTDRRRFAIQAVARWQLETVAGYCVGCQFLYDQGTYLLQAILPKPKAITPWSVSNIWRRFSRWL